MSQQYNHIVEIELSYDRYYERMHVKDNYGEFIPFPYQMWWHCVEKPYRNYFKQKGTSYQRVIEIFIGDYAHRYICNN